MTDRRRGKGGRLVGSKDGLYYNKVFGYSWNGRETRNVYEKEVGNVRKEGSRWTL